MSTPAGWYPDPEREGSMRWWDGSAWAASQADAATPAAEPAATADPGAEAASHSPFDGRSGGSAASAVDVPKPSWATDATPSWQQSTPSWDAGQQGGAQPTPAYDQAGQYGQQPTAQFTQPYDQFSDQQFGQPKKKRTGLIITLVSVGAFVVVGGLIALGIFVLPGLFNQGNQAGPTDPADPSAPSGFPLTVDLDIPQDGQAANQVTIVETGTYTFTVTSVNGEDPRMSLVGNGVDLEDDDTNGLDPYIETTLTPGDYTITVEEYSGDPLTATLTVDVLASAVEPVEEFPAQFDLSIGVAGIASVPIEVAEAGAYTIAVDSTNGEDPAIELITAGGESFSDDDGGGYPNSLLTQHLEAGAHVLSIEELGGDPLTVTVSITQG